LLCALYLLGVYSLPHDTPTKQIGVGALVVAFLFLTLAVYLTPALFKTYNARGERTYPSGVVFSWIDAFVLPDTTGDAPAPVSVPGQVTGQLSWRANLQKALAEAAKSGKRVFVDFTGETCTNCKLNERQVFSRPEIRELLQQYILVQLYTDRIPDRYYNSAELEGSPTNSVSDAMEKNLAFERDKFDTETLPLYVILEPVGPQDLAQVKAYKGATWLPDSGYKEVAREEVGLIRDVGAFKALLEKNARKK
jgi:thiol:disulfide interchange protein DsbD